MAKLIVANWKAQLAPEAAERWLDIFLQSYAPTPGIQVVLTPGFTFLDRIRRRLPRGGGILLAAQAVSPYPAGNYTGAVPAAWLRGLASYVLVGHQERRRYFHESVADIANQVSEAVAAGLLPIICLDRSQAAAQVAALNDSDREEVFLAYTPAEAVQLEIVRQEADIVEVASYLRALSGGRPLLYGGGVNGDNAARLVALPQLAGIMVGRACLDALEFGQLVGRAARAAA